MIYLIVLFIIDKNINCALCYIHQYVKQIFLKCDSTYIMK